MKILTTSLRGRTSPHPRRMTALVHNTEHKQKTGKSMLSDAELHTLTQGWAARMGETNEYNRYLEIARPP